MAVIYGPLEGIVSISIDCNGTTMSIKYCYKYRTNLRESIFTLLYLLKDGNQLTVNNSIEIERTTCTKKTPPEML